MENLPAAWSKRRASWSPSGARAPASRSGPAAGPSARACTGGRGVDVLVAGRGGPVLGRAASLLAPFGRLCLVGAGARGRDVGPGALGRGVSLFSVDLAALVAARPSVVGDLLRRALAVPG